MKQLFLALIICCMCAGSSRASTVSGTVTSTVSCGPVSGQIVYLRDSFYNYLDSAVTNSSGAYSINFPTSWASGKPFLITIPACGNVWNTTGHYLGGSQTVNPVICGSAKRLYGTLMLGTMPNSGPAIVYLVKVQRNNPILGDTTLTAVDSVILNGTGSFAFTRTCAPNDTFLLKAALRPGHSSYSSYLPSYDSSLTWSTATRYTASRWTVFAGAGVNIFLFPGVNPGGPAFIGGSVLVGANKGTAVGDPLASRLLILSNSSTGAPVAYTYSDAAGHFSFPSVPYGTYKLFGDSWGLYNIPLTVTVSASQKTVNNIIFEENYGENTFKGHFSSTSVSNTGGLLENVTVYPNPATTSIAIKGISQIKGSKTLTLRNLLGTTLSTKSFTDGAPVEMAIDAIPAGTYMLQLSTEAGTASFKILK